MPETVDSRGPGGTAGATDGASPPGREGMALVTVVMALLVMTSLVAAAFATTYQEMFSVRATQDAATGFFSAEAGLNIRGEQVRAVFQGYSRPAGESPDPVGACEGTNLGQGDLECLTFEFNRRNVITYVSEDPRNNDPDDEDRMITIPGGEVFAGLNAIQYRYSVVSMAVPTFDDRPEAILEMVFRARLVPLFQFAAFYNKDLEILPGPNMTLGGPVHVNGDLYLNANNTLHMLGNITVGGHESGTGGSLRRGRKDANECYGAVRVNDADVSTNPDPDIPCPRRAVPQSELDAWNGRIQTGMEGLTIPAPESFAPGGMYWHEADLVLALDLRNGFGPARVVVPNRNFSGGVGNVTVNESLTTVVEQCLSSAPRSYDVQAHPQVGGLPVLPSPARAAEWSNTFRDRRENPSNDNARNAYRLLLEVDVRGLLECMHDNPSLFGDGPAQSANIGDDTNGGLVWYFTVLGPFSLNASSGYGVRLRNGARLAAINGMAPDIQGLTVVSDQAVMVEGDYNLDGFAGARWRPAAVLADAIHILSNEHQSRWSNHISGIQAASNTTIQAAFMGGTQTTGGQEGQAGEGGNYNGGLENYPTLHENWSSRVLTHRGSFVSLDRPRYSSGAWGGHYYSPPVRDWFYDIRFNEAHNLPPMSPRFVYLLQERFVREFRR